MMSTRMQRPEILLVGEPEWLEIQRILTTARPAGQVWAFGSRVHPNRPKVYSDLDLVIKSSHRLSSAETAELNDLFDHSDLPWKVDILDWNAISERFQQVILTNYCVIWESKVSNH